MLQTPKEWIEKYKARHRAEFKDELLDHRIMVAVGEEIRGRINSALEYEIKEKSTEELIALWEHMHIPQMVDPELEKIEKPKKPKKPKRGVRG